ncbi:MAG: hypothetical protein ACYCZK_07950, partial [Microbacteriaceae bacterium]
MTRLSPEERIEAERPVRRRRVHWLRWGGALVAVLAVAIGALFGARLGKDPSLVSTPLIGEPAP